MEDYLVLSLLLSGFISFTLVSADQVEVRSGARRMGVRSGRIKKKLSTNRKP